MASLRCKHTDICLQQKLVYPIRKKRIKKENLKKKRNKEIRDYSLPKSYKGKEWRTNPSLPLLPGKTEQKQKKIQIEN